METCFMKKWILQKISGLLSCWNFNRCPFKATLMFNGATQRLWNYSAQQNPKYYLQLYQQMFITEYHWGVHVAQGTNGELFYEKVIFTENFWSPVLKKLNLFWYIPWARSIQPKFPEISVQNAMDRFGPTGKVSKKLVHLLRWSSFPGRTGLNFGWMDRAPCLWTCLSKGSI